MNRLRLAKTEGEELTFFSFSFQYLLNIYEVKENNFPYFPLQSTTKKMKFLAVNNFHRMFTYIRRGGRMQQSTSWPLPMLSL